MAVDDRHEVAGCLLRSYLFEGMTAEQIGPLARVSATRRLVRGEYAWHAGDPAEELYVVLSGEVKDCLVDTDGNEVIHFTHGPGMTLGEPGFFAQERYRILDCIAMMPTTLIRLSRGDLWPFLERHGVMKDRALEALASDLRFQTNLISSLLTQPLAQRLVLRLLELIDSTPERRSGQAVTPKITQSTPDESVHRRAVSRLGAAAIVIMATGYGWVGGNFSTATDRLPVKVAITLGHLILPAALAVLAGLLAVNPGSPGTRRAVTGVAWVSVLFVVVSTGYALANPDPNAFGPHNAADYTAIVILLAGAVLWLFQRYLAAATSRQACGAAGEWRAPDDSATSAPVQNS